MGPFILLPIGIAGNFSNAEDLLRKEKDQEGNVVQDVLKAERSDNEARHNTLDET